MFSQSPALTQREHQRSNISVNMTWRPLLHYLFREAKAIDSSKGGLRLETKRNPPAIGDLIEVKDENDFHSYCVVRWSRKASETDKINFGVEIVAKR